MEDIEGKIKEVDITLVEMGKNAIPKHIDSNVLKELADSIKEHGMINPVIVTEEEGKYYIIDGEQRWRAAQLAGLKTIPIFIQ